MSQPLPFDETKFDKNVFSNEILNTPDGDDIGYFSKVDLSYPHNIRQKTIYFSPLAPESKFIYEDDFSYYFNKTEPENYAKQKN